MGADDDIDQILDPGALDALSGEPVTALRSRRDTCHEAELLLSYRRRLLQGQLDIARAEQRRRAGGGSGDDAPALVGNLADILADAPAPGARQARNAPLYATQHADADPQPSDPALSRLPDLDAAELDALVGRLSDAEETVSDRRRRVLDALDTLQAALVERYRTDGVDVDEVVAEHVDPDVARG